MLTSAGLNKRQDLGDASFLYFAVGSGSATFSLGMTAMGSEIERIAVTSVEVDGATITFTAFFNSTQGNGVWREWGIWDAASGGNLLAYDTIASPITKDSTSPRMAVLEDTLSNA